MLFHSVTDPAVGLAANGLNATGSTPSTFTNTPLTLIRPAATGTAASTPASLRIRPTEAAGSELGSTTSRSAGSNFMRLAAVVLRDAGSGFALTVSVPWVAWLAAYGQGSATPCAIPGMLPTLPLTPVARRSARADLEV